MINFILPKINFSIEKWKWNKEFRVYVSNLGSFKDEHRRPLPIKVGTNGYCYIKTDRGFKTAHRLVMLTWKPIPNAETLTIDHLNHNKRENTIYNLEWVTRKENLNRACNDLIKIQENEESKINKQSDFIIYANKAKFNSFDDAAKWIAKKNGMKENTNLDMVKKSILSSIRTQKKYCNINWQMSFKK